jgi:hypothetical protein
MAVVATAVACPKPGYPAALLGLKFKVLKGYTRVMHGLQLRTKL